MGGANGAVRPVRAANAWGSLLRTAAGLTGPFTLSGLVVAAWRADPARFGLRQYEREYPDANAVRVALFGAKGLIRRGYLRRVSENVYDVTPAGREAVHVGGSSAPVSLTLGMIVRSEAFRDWRRTYTHPRNFPASLFGQRPRAMLDAMREELRRLAELGCGDSDLADADDFLTAMHHRFADHFGGPPA